jgi:DNA polymerase-3 subunit delta'
LASEGVDATRAAEVAGASNGSVERARLLANDDHFAARRDAWRSVPSRLDGTGASIALLVDELRELIDDAQAPLVARHEVERADLDRREEALGTRGSGRKLLEARHKREIRSVRDDELSFGLGTVGGVYRRVLVDHPMPSIIVSALQRLSAAGEALGRNPNEKLLLLALFVELPTLSSS